MYQNMRRSKEREQNKWVNVQNTFTAHTTSNPHHGVFSITHYETNDSDDNYLPKIYSGSEGDTSIVVPSYLPPEGDYLPPEEEIAPHRRFQVPVKQYPCNEV